MKRSHEPKPGNMKERLLKTAAIISLGATGLSACGNQAEAEPYNPPASAPIETEVPYEEPNNNNVDVNDPSTPETPTPDFTEDTLLSPQEMAGMSHEELVEAWTLKMSLEDFQDFDKVAAQAADSVNVLLNRFSDPEVLDQQYLDYNLGVDGQIKVWAGDMATSSINAANEAQIGESSPGSFGEDMWERLDAAYRLGVESYLLGGSGESAIYTESVEVDPGSIVISSTDVNENGEIIRYDIAAMDFITSTNVHETVFPDNLWFFEDGESMIQQMESERPIHNVNMSIVLDEQTGVVTTIVHEQ